MKASRLNIQKNEGVARLILHRPEAHNALDDELILEITTALKNIKTDEGVRVLVLSGEGKNFCAGADINWMKKSIDFSKKENEKDALQLHNMLTELYCFPKPTIARVQGVALGGGVGLMAACDVSVATHDAQMALSEVKLGILPAVISPFVIRKIGVGAFRAYGVSAKRFSAEEALRLGLVQEIVQMNELDSTIGRWIEIFKSNGPQAMAKVKEISEQVACTPFSKVSKITTKTIAKVRVSPEGQEGLNAFLEKREPIWKKESKRS